MATEQSKEWLKCYINTGNAKECVKVNYPDVAEENRASKASRLKRQHQAAIVNELQHKLAQDAPQIVNVLKDIALNTSGDVRPSEQLKAASEWLQRCLPNQPQVIEVKKTVTHAQLLIDANRLMKAIEPKLLTNLIEQPKEAIEHGKQSKH